MINQKVFLFLLFAFVQLFNNSNLSAQNTTGNIFADIERSEKGKGTIKILQSASLNDLIYKHSQINNNKLRGYRIQIYMGTGSDARNQANKHSLEFTKTFPEFNVSQVYAIYETPYFKLRVGDYRTKNEAFEDLFKIQKTFPDAYIVNSTIKYPKL